MVICFTHVGPGRWSCRVCPFFKEESERWPKFCAAPGQILEETDVFDSEGTSHYATRLLSHKSFCFISC